LSTKAREAFIEEADEISPSVPRDILATHEIVSGEPGRPVALLAVVGEEPHGDRLHDQSLGELGCGERKVAGGAEGSRTLSRHTTNGGPFSVLRSAEKATDPFGPPLLRIHSSSKSISRVSRFS
jgi:hypothetical protein